MSFDEQSVLKRLQRAELEILEVFSEYCAQHNLRWFLDGGTALGAARHQGFIPWDDDIDVGMLREDYDRFIACALDDFPEGYSLHTPETSPGLAGMFAKIYKDGTEFSTEESLAAGIRQGIFIDVFPYDRLAMDKKSSSWQIRNARLWQSLSYLYHSPHIVVPHKGILGSVERAGCRFAHGVARLLLNERGILLHFDKSRLVAGERSDYVLPFAWPNMKPVPIKLIIPASRAHFEGRVYPAPALIDAYLQQMYGDWRKLPKPEDRKTHLPIYVRFADGAEWHAARK